MEQGRQAELLKEMGVIAKGASQAICQVRKRGYETIFKADYSPVTEADYASHRFITEALAKLTPDIPIISEEDRKHPDIQKTQYFWLIDPLDGTRGFAEGDSSYAVNIALISGTSPLLGVVALPDYEEIYYGSPDLGAWRQIKEQDRTRIKVRTRSQGENVILLSRHTPPTKILEEFLEKHAPYKLKKISSAVKFMIIASGHADFYPRFAPTMEWDTGAPQAIVEGAGGKIMTPDGHQLSYRKTDWRNGSFICCA